MARTKRKGELRREAQVRQGERAYYQTLERRPQKSAMRRARSPDPRESIEPISVRAIRHQPRQPAALPPQVAQAKSELEAMLNGNKALSVSANAPIAQKAREQPFSVQSPPSTLPMEQTPFIWWSGMSIDEYVPIAQYGEAGRQRDLQTFALLSPLILNAMSTMIKKAQALEWFVEGGRNSSNKWRNRILGFSKNFSTLIGQWVRGYCESDQGGIVELIRAAPGWAVDENGQLTARGEAAIARGADKAWEIVDASVFDPAQIVYTNSEEFPLNYNNPRTGRKHQLRDYNFMSLVDMPVVDYRYKGAGLCAVSRAVWAAQEDRMVTRFAYEAMSENPGTGMMFVNASDQQMRTAIKATETEREGRGAIFYKGVVFIPVLNPEGTFSAEYIAFSHWPADFGRTEVYNICKEVVATAFGLDVLEMGSMAGANLGTGAQATVLDAKSRGKGLGVIVSGIEREFRFKLLPEALEFHFSKQDIEEERAEAEVHSVLFKNALAYAQIAGPQKAEQYLADNGAISEEYLTVDITSDVEVEDTESEAGAAATQATAAQVESEPLQQGPGQRPAGGQGAIKAKAREPIVRAWSNGRTVEKRAVPHFHTELKQVGLPTFQPLVSGALPEFDATITEEDIVRANRKWDVLMPELAGLLDARTVKR